MPAPSATAPSSFGHQSRGEEDLCQGPAAGIRIRQAEIHRPKEFAEITDV